MKLKIITILTVIFSILTTQAQNNNGKVDDFTRIAIVPYVANQVENIPLSARNNLQNKMGQILTKNGIAGSVGYQNPFIITPNVSVLSKNIVAGAPPKIALTLEITFYIGDGINGVKYGSATVNVKGVGSNENKAYLSAFKNIKNNNPELTKLIDLSKNRILEYYNDNCNFILKEVDNLTSQNKFNEALYTLTSIPKVSKDCFNNAQDKIAFIYTQKINRDCEILLNKAKNAWNNGQNFEAAQNASHFLNQIEPEAKCYSQVKYLANSIKVGIQKNTDKEWNFLNKQLKSTTDIEKNRLNNIKEIALAYAKNSPQNVVYSIKGWW
jgi:hypothetical protein